MRKSAPDAELDMTPMIDVVFQLIIFFVVTVALQDQALETKVRMAMSPHGPVEEVKDPRTVTLDVNDAGTVSIMRTRLNESQLYSILRKTAIESGQSTPVVIRGDWEAKHEEIRRVMDLIGKAGLWKIRFAALKEKAAQQ